MIGCSRLRGGDHGMVGRSARALTPRPHRVSLQIHAKGGELYLHQQGIDTTTPSGKAMFQMMGVFADFERAMVPERVLAGA
jgi:DNA invertase Pin-like site-specific DNA recombinase